MTIETILHYVDLYGYLIIFVLLFFGIIGVPAPEESLLFVIGILVGYQKLDLWLSIVVAVIGVWAGMIGAYYLGKRIGTPFFQRYGKYIGVTNNMIDKVKIYYMKNAYKAIFIGLYVPGLRQISPYFAGIVHVPNIRYFVMSLLASILWVVSYIVGGYYAGITFDVNPKYAPYVGVIVFVIFLMYILFKKLQPKRQ